MSPELLTASIIHSPARSFVHRSLKVTYVSWSSTGSINYIHERTNFVICFQPINICFLLDVILIPFKLLHRTNGVHWMLELTLSFMLVTWIDNIGKLFACWLWATIALRALSGLFGLLIIHDPDTLCCVRGYVCIDKPSLPLFSDIFDHPDRRLPSRCPVWLLQLPASDFSVGTRWKEAWDHFQVTNHSLIADPTARVPGFDLPRRLWVRLNGFRTGQGSLCSKPPHLEVDWQPAVLMWTTTDDVPHCWCLPVDKVSRWSTTLCWWQCCWVVGRSLHTLRRRRRRSM